MKRNDFRNSATRLYCSSFYSTKLFLIEKTNKQNKQTKQNKTNKQTNKAKQNKQTNKAKQNKQTKQNKTKQSQRVSVGSIKCIVIYLTVRNRSR